MHHFQFQNLDFILKFVWSGLIGLSETSPCYWCPFLWSCRYGCAKWQLWVRHCDVIHNVTMILDIADHFNLYLCHVTFNLRLSRVLQAHPKMRWDTRVVSTKCTPGFACRAFSDTTLICFIFIEYRMRFIRNTLTWCQIHAMRWDKIRLIKTTDNIRSLVSWYIYGSYLDANEKNTCKHIIKWCRHDYNIHRTRSHNDIQDLPPVVNHLSKDEHYHMHNCTHFR